MIAAFPPTYSMTRANGDSGDGVVLTLVDNETGKDVAGIGYTEEGRRMVFKFCCAAVPVDVIESFIKHAKSALPKREKRESD